MNYDLIILFVSTLVYALALLYVNMQLPKTNASFFENLVTICTFYGMASSLVIAGWILFYKIGPEALQ